jgi:hypothetical protein
MSSVVDSPGSIPSLNAKILIDEFVTGSKNEVLAEDVRDVNLAGWLPRRVIWEDVPECISAGLRREGFME